MKQIKMRHLIIAIFVFTISIALFLLMAICTSTILNCHGFTLDDTGQMFIGRSGRIDVYDREGSLKYSIFSKAFSRGYAFAIQENEIYVSTGSYCNKISLTGDILEEYEENPPYTYDQLQRNRWRHISNSGMEYRFRLFGRLAIMDSNATILWQEPMISSVIRLGLLLSICFWVIAVVSLVLLYLERWYPPKTI